MMERVQITGQAGDGQYYDNKGRLLYAMGDINITPGMWVWTNGKTIYGHQTAGEQVVNFSPRGILPCVRYGDMLEITSDGTLKPFVYMSGLSAYVGDHTHAYIAIDNYRSYPAFDWYNVMTGDKVGTFAVSDACIDTRTGDLLTICAGQGGSDTIIRRNGNIVRRIPTEDKLQRIIEMTSNEVNRLNQLNPNPRSDRPKDELQAQVDVINLRLYPDLYSEIFYTCISSAITYPGFEYLKSEAVESGLKNRYGVDYGEASSVVDIPYEPVREISKYAGVDVRTVILYDIIYYDLGGLVTFKYSKDFGQANTNVFAFLAIDNAETISEGLYVNVQALKYTGNIVRNVYDPQHKESIPVLKGYEKIKAILFTVYAKRREKWHPRVTSAITSNTNYLNHEVDFTQYPWIEKFYLSLSFKLAVAILYGIKNLCDPLPETKYGIAIDSNARAETVRDKSYSGVKSYKLNNGYSISVHMNSENHETFPYSIKSADIFDPSMKRIASWNYDQLNVFNYIYNASWLGLRIAKIRGDKYIFFSSCSTYAGGIFLLDNNNISHIGLQNGTFSATPFFNRELLKQKLKIIADKAQIQFTIL